MSFTSFSFLLFLGCVTVLYYIVPKKMQSLLLLAASYSFYMVGGIGMAGYLVFSTAVTYGAGLLLGQLNHKKHCLPAADKAAGKRIKRQMKAVVAMAVALCFGLLFFLKYWNFTASFLHRAFAGSLCLPQLNLLLPLGISFYLFQSIGYVVDCFRGKYPPERNLLKYSLFVSFFPQIVQGPISRFDQLGPQLPCGHAFDADQVKYGIQLLLWGYFKKIVIADRAAILVNTVFAEYSTYSGSIIALSVLFYCIQLYCDFSGGIDITRGAAQMLGIELVDNFRRPLFATSLADYWRRWHITLGQWMKDYVFFSLTLSKPFMKLGKWTRRTIPGKLGKILPTSLATFLVYFIIGIWHGANFRYVFFGFWNGFIITLSLLLANFYLTLQNSLHIADDSRLLKLWRMVRTWFLVFIGRYITRAPRLLTAFSMMWATVSRPVVSDLWNGTVLSLGLSLSDLLVVLTSIFVVCAVEYAQEKGVRIRKWLEQRSFLLQWLAIFLPLTVLLLFGIMRGGYISSEFIYKQF